MPRRNDFQVESLAEEIIRREQKGAGNSVRKLSKPEERRLGCDFVVSEPDGAEYLVEIKGWGESLLDEHGRFRYTTELRTAQWRASENPNWRLEIVANLTEVREGRGVPERLTLNGRDLAGRATPALWDVDLRGLEDRIREAAPPALEGMDIAGGDAAFWADMDTDADEAADDV